MKIYCRVDPINEVTLIKVKVELKLAYRFVYTIFETMWLSELARRFICLFSKNNSICFMSVICYRHT
jgi:hypothetical protein